MHVDLNFCRLDLYKSKASRFEIVDGKLLPPFSSIDGMGEIAAEAVEAAAVDGPYLSRMISVSGRRSAKRSSI